MQITSALLRQMGKEIEEAVASIAEKHGVDISYGGGRYDVLSATLKLKISARTSDGKTKAQVDFENYAKLYDLDPSLLGQTVKMRNRHYKIVGLNPRCTKNAVSLERVPDGRGFKCSPEHLKTYLRIASAVGS
jgi:hypothetical protein